MKTQLVVQVHVACAYAGYQPGIWVLSQSACYAILPCCLHFLVISRQAPPPPCPCLEFPSAPACTRFCQRNFPLPKLTALLQILEYHFAIDRVWTPKAICKLKWTHTAVSEGTRYFQYHDVYRPFGPGIVVGTLQVRPGGKLV